jgi:hypothetical protein
VQRDQSVSEMAQEILLARRAMALVQRSEEPLIEALEDILLKTPAGSRPLKPMGAPDQEEEPLLFPSFGYYLDESDPDIVVLRRQDGSYVAAFSAIGATREGFVEAAKEDYAALLGKTRSIRPRATKSATAPERRTRLSSYSPECMQGLFCELRLNGVLRRLA